MKYRLIIDNLSATTLRWYRIEHQSAPGEKWRFEASGYEKEMVALFDRIKNKAEPITVVEEFEI